MASAAITPFCPASIAADAPDGFIDCAATPAEYLPLKGGDLLLQRASLISGPAELVPWRAVGAISPLEGEMAGRPEGGMSAVAGRKIVP